MKEKQLRSSNGHYRNFGTEIYEIAVSSVKTDESCDRLTLASFVTQLRILCQMEGGQCCHRYALSTFYLKNSTCK